MLKQPVVASVMTTGVSVAIACPANSALTLPAMNTQITILNDILITVTQPSTLTS
jgi:hypothetical protein